ncbi:MCE family protein [Saccharomonospora iraqiensis]|uniref:MCE family protein n=1 Tax=Saccharomonospora iraqiensis TaxID=52698 RepID=UPI00022E5A43|nr:MCE family protein [Saccharomonospora iraqiensis]
MIRRPSRMLAVVCVLALVAASGWYVLLRPEPRLRLAADFASASGIHPGSDVAVLGVPLGTVESVDPRGPTVRVTMTLPGDTAVPADAHAYIMNPAVISDRFVELAPAHTGGERLSDGAVIPVGRTHAPVTWNELTSSLDTLLDAVAPTDPDGDGDLATLVRRTADALEGNGPALREAIAGLAGATDVLAEGAPEVGALVEDVDSLVTLVADHRRTIDSVTAAVTNASADLAEHEDSVARALTQLSEALGSLSRLLDGHGTELTGDVSRLAEVSTTLVARRDQLAETLDTLPLALQNFDRALTEDDRLRIRLDLSTNLSQFPTTARLCERLSLPLCEGAGLVNPIDFPPEVDDPFGLRALLDGGGR